MTDPQTYSQTVDAQLERALTTALGTQAAAGRPAPTPPPASSAGPRPTGLWGPTTQRATSPLELLSKAADSAQRLHEQLGRLVTSVTGEQAPPKGLRQAPMKVNGLLPAISEIAHQIDIAHGEIDRLVQYLQSRVS